MKINSGDLYKFINELGINEKVRFKVYYDDNYVTEVYWNGENFEWDSGAFTSEAFFNALYDFEVIEEEKDIEKLDKVIVNNETMCDLEIYLRQDENVLIHKINELIDAVNKLNKTGKIDN